MPKGGGPGPAPGGTGRRPSEPAQRAPAALRAVQGHVLAAVPPAPHDRPTGILLDALREAKVTADIQIARAQRRADREAPRVGRMIELLKETVHHIKDPDLKARVIQEIEGSTGPDEALQPRPKGR